MIQRSVFERASKTRVQTREERITGRGDGDLVAGWSRSTQHATIRYYTFILS